MIIFICCDKNYSKKFRIVITPIFFLLYKQKIVSQGLILDNRFLIINQLPNYYKLLRFVITNKVVVSMAKN